MAPVVPALLMAGKLGLKFLPAIGAVAGAAPGLRRGNIGEALLGGGLGALGFPPKHMINSPCFV